MTIGRRTLLIGSGAIGLGGAAAIIAYRSHRAAEVERAVAPERGLIGFWRFNQTAGSLVLDSSGEGNDGVVIPTAAADHAWGNGDFSGTIALGGVRKAFVQIPASPSLNRTVKQVTVVANVYPGQLWSLGSSSNDFIAVVQRQWRDGVHPDLYYLGFGLSADVLTYKWHVGLVGNEPAIYALPVNGDRPRPGAWVHLAGVYNGDTGEMSLHVDGRRIATETHPGELRLDVASLERPLMIGAELNSPSTTDASNPFDGYVDEVRLYESALSDEQIATLAAAVKPGSSR